MESDLAARPLQLRLLGPLAVRRDGAEAALPASRKARALVGYLAMATRPASRSQLCELLWDVPSDPRGELRWCLSKLRGVLDEPGRRRVVAQGEAVSLDLGDCFVDALEVERAAQAGVEALPPERLEALAALFAGDFLDGLEVDRNPGFAAWLTGQRRRFRARHAALLERLARIAEGEAAIGHLEKWLGLAPFDLRAQEALLAALARGGRIREAEAHLAAAIRQFEGEGLETGPLREAWRAARARPEGVAASARRQPSETEPAAAGAALTETRRASIAVMPFAERGGAETAPGGPAGGLAHDIITRLAKLRSLFVIAQGSVFALSERRVGPEEAGRMLNVDYVVSGGLLRRGDRIAVSVELAETRSARIVWAETFERKDADAFIALEEIGDRIVASIASEIETAERNRAILKPPNSLDAWEAHHRGLWHMYRFHRADNEQARHFFEAALRLDPTFAPAYAGLSFTHFQNAFQGWTQREAEIERAVAAAGQSLMADERDPTAHWAMGRALWLGDRKDQAVLALERAVDLSPNFALGHYALAFVHSQGGDPEAAIGASDHSRLLSPFDPMLFGMLGARAMALVRLERFEEAADWAIKAAARPNAHAHILAIAAYCLALAGRQEEARGFMAAIRRGLPDYSVEDFLTAMRFSPDGAALFRAAAKRLGA